MRSSNKYSTSSLLHPHKLWSHWCPIASPWAYPSRQADPDLLPPLVETPHLETSNLHSFRSSRRHGRCARMSTHVYRIRIAHSARVCRRFALSIMDMQISFAGSSLIMPGWQQPVTYAGLLGKSFPRDGLFHQDRQELASENLIFQPKHT